ncbi:MAG: aminoacyl-histidine dipeptidase [Rikenellaceae bacterium]
MISKLEPTLVWGFFDEITKIPRPSKKEEKIIAYLIDFAVKNSLEYKCDETGNVVIYKNAQNSNSDETVILQSHVDMVCEKNSDKVFNFDTDPIETYIEDGWVKANGTTLGADCGIGMALTMAVLASNDISHPKIEALFTVDEETGLTGAFGLSDDLLKGKYLINLDSEDEGELFVGCAGGIDTIAEYEFDYCTSDAPKTSLKLEIKGLKGGHSGDDINKGYANANILMARFLIDLYETKDLSISDINGGNLRNAIPRECFAILNVDSSDVDYIKKAFADFEAVVKDEYHATEDKISFETHCLGEKEMCEFISQDIIKNLLKLVFLAPNGVQDMSFDLENLVETSTNLASIKINAAEKLITVSSSQRSSVNSKKIYLSKVMKTLFESCGAKVIQSDGYPGWTPKMDSKLLDIFVKSYSRLFNVEAKVKAIHAGLECGLFLEKYPHLEMISVGPTLRRVHSPEEKIEISTVGMTWDLLAEVLKGL